MERSWVVAAALLLAAGGALRAQPEQPTKVDVVLEKADLERSPEGVSLTISGAAPGMPNRTRVRLALRLEGGDGASIMVEVNGGRFAGKLGPFRRRVLPGTYEVLAVVDPALQRVDLAEQISAITTTPGRRELQIGTPEEAAVEREKLKRRYVQILDVLRIVNGELDMWGSSVVMRTVALRMRHRQAIPANETRALETEWGRVSEEFGPNLAAIRFDLQQLGEFFLAGYYPQLQPLLEQIMTTLDRWHAAFYVAIWGNLGRRPPADVAAKGTFGIDDLRRSLRSLAEQAYSYLGVSPQTWTTIDGSVPEQLDDAEGDLFHSTVSKFEVRKPSDWAFRLGSTPTMRLRMVPEDASLAGRIVTGIELRDQPLADSFDELAELDEALTRQLHPGFELRKIRRISAPDPTMPGNVRPGQEITFVTTQTTPQGEKRYSFLQYSLFCRWHKRTYTLVCLTEDGLEARFQPVFAAICDSFKVLDAPGLQPESGR